MKKTAISMLIVGLLCGSAFPFKMGLEFQVGQQQQIIGANLRISDLFELKPKLGFLINSSDNPWGNSSTFSLGVDGNFYLSDLGQLQQYAGFGIGFTAVKDGDGAFGMDGHYGLRYNINESFSLFGQLGLGFIFTPEFEMSTHSTGAGITFYILNK